MRRRWELRAAQSAAPQLDRAAAKTPGKGRMVVVDGPDTWSYFSLPCMMLASAAGCVWLRRRGGERGRLRAEERRVQHVVAMGVVDEAAMASLSRTPARGVAVAHHTPSRFVPPPSPYCVPRAAPGLKDADMEEMLELDKITLEDETKLKENFSSESVFQMKVGWLDRQLHKLHTGQEKPIKIEVDRDDIFFDSFRAFSKCTGAQLRGPLQVKFKREEGRDDGGLTRHWFMLISRQIVNPDYAMFTLVGKRDTYQINPASKHQSHYLDYFRFIGRVWGKAIYDGFLVESHFALCIYKFILAREMEVADLMAVDHVYCNSLTWFLENDIEAAELDLVFVVEEEELGEIIKKPLKDGGELIPVTNENKAEYVHLAAMHRLVGSVRPQVCRMSCVGGCLSQHAATSAFVESSSCAFLRQRLPSPARTPAESPSPTPTCVRCTRTRAQLEAVREGFYEVMPKDVLSKFSEMELELLLHGMPVIDVEVHHHLPWLVRMCAVAGAVVLKHGCMGRTGRRIASIAPVSAPRTRWWCGFGSWFKSGTKKHGRGCCSS